jgi:hypothetical protein
MADGRTSANRANYKQCNCKITYAEVTFFRTLSKTTALVVLKGSVFWDTTPYSPLKANRHFGRKGCLHIQGCCLPATLSSLTLHPWRWRRYVPPKCRLTLTGLHVIYKMRELFTTTAVRTSHFALYQRVMTEPKELAVWNFTRQTACVCYAVCK